MLQSPTQWSDFDVKSVNPLIIITSNSPAFGKYLKAKFIAQ